MTDPGKQEFIETIRNQYSENKIVVKRPSRSNATCEESLNRKELREGEIPGRRE